MRLAALKESPDAFVATHERGAAYDEHVLARPDAALDPPASPSATGSPVGVASVGAGRRRTTRPSPSSSACGCTPDARGTGVATKLVQAGRRTARRGRQAPAAYWVGTDNGRAVAFASGFGFRPTDSRRPMRVVSEDDGEEEIAMVLPPLRAQRPLASRPSDARELGAPRRPGSRSSRSRLRGGRRAARSGPSAR